MGNVDVYTLSPHLENVHLLHIVDVCVLVRAHALGLDLEVGNCNRRWNNVKLDKNALKSFKEAVSNMFMTLTPPGLTVDLVFRARLALAGGGQASGAQDNEHQTVEAAVGHDGPGFSVR